MSLFFETLKVTKREIENLSFHNKRLNETIFQNFGKMSDIDLSSYVHQKDFTKQRCKVIYNEAIQSIQFYPLVQRKFQSFKLLETDIKYNFKNVDREEINRAYAKRGDCDDVLIIQDGLVKDTTIANIALYDGKEWITPKSPLLKGTMRASLLERQIILEKDVRIKDIKNAVRFALMNALIGFYEVEDFKISD